MLRDRSQALIHNRWSDGGDTIQDQTRQALTNCQAILRAGGASLDDVIEVEILLTRPTDFAGLKRNTRGGSRPIHRPRIAAGAGVAGLS
jgi:enamine deaminase RidA (YjgF/YER057c/UK114 family)